jgi:hypothetical protein
MQLANRNSRSCWGSKTEVAAAATHFCFAVKSGFLDVVFLFFMSRSKAPITSNYRKRRSRLNQ